MRVLFQGPEVGSQGRPRVYVAAVGIVTTTVAVMHRRMSDLIDPVVE